MLKHHYRLLGGAGAVVTACVIALSGAMTASAAPAGPRPATAGTEHFQFMSTSGAGNTGRIIASGLFTAAGIDHEGAHNLSKFVFADGTIRIRHLPGKGPQHFDPSTCLLTVHLHGTYQLLGGTGRYAGISGGGRYQLSILAIGAKSNGKCTNNKPPVALEQLIRASGPVRL
jgi:hypothetical protein